jgi:hypothetical protein
MVEVHDVPTPNLQQLASAAAQPQTTYVECIADFSFERTPHVSHSKHIGLASEHNEPLHVTKMRIDHGMKNWRFAHLRFNQRREFVRRA